MDRDDIIYADGSPAETFIDCDSRGIFHNAPEFGELYPDDRGQQWASCAPRIESGPVLERIRRAIDRAVTDAEEADSLDGLLDTLLSGIDNVRRLRATQRLTTGDDRLLVPAAPVRSRAKMALIVSDLLPRPGRDIGSSAILSHIAALRSLGWDVEIVASADLARGDDAAAVLKAWRVTCHRAPSISSAE